jgi:trimeric autotransporter adhesin
MTKKTIYLLLFFFLTTLMTGQVQVGVGTNTFQRLPFNPPFEYSYGQSIYLASEIGATGNITSIQWYYAGSGNLANSQQLVIYMAHTAKTEFDSTTDWIPVAALTQVYSGGITTNGTPGWINITLDTPFAYNGTDNLVIAADENHELSDEFNDKFYNSAVTIPRSLYVYYDFDNIDPASPPEAYNTVNFVPTIIFGGIAQPCPTPFYVSSNQVTTTTAQITWQAPPVVPAMGSEYYLSTSDAAPDAATDATGSVAAGESVDIDGLTPETVYYVWVRNHCDADLYSSWSAIYMFKTDCVAVANFFEDFDGVATPDIPSCWNKIMRGGANLSPYARIETSDWYSQSGSNSIVLDPDSSDETLADVILASPHVSTLSEGTHRLKFYAKGSGVLQIGTLSTNDNNAVFTENGTGSIDVTSVMTEYAVDFSGYTGSDKYIGIRGAGSNATVYIDNIKWELLPSCPDVTAVDVPSVTPAEAIITWASGNSATTVSWDVVVGTDSDTDPDVLTFQNATETTAQINGLTANTAYKVWVRTVCSSENGAWIGPVHFRTACSGIANFYENFNQAVTPDLVDCWGAILRGADLSEFSEVATNAYSGLFEDGDNAVRLMTSDAGADEDLILVSPNLTTLSLGTYRLKFYAKHDYYPADVDIVTLSSNTNAAVVTLIQTIDLTDETAQYVVNFSDYTGPDTYIGFRLHATDPYSSVFLDNILWEINPSCPDVTGIQVPENSASGATITWTPSDDNVSWDVAIGSDTEDPNSVAFINYSDPTAVITGLADNTVYNVWVRSVCTNDDKGAWIGPVAFSTACLPVAGFSEDFEAVTTPALPACWSRIMRGATVGYSAYVKTTPYANLPDPTNSIVISTADSMPEDDVILVSPNVSTLGLGSYRLKFKAKGLATLSIGTLTGNTADAVFTPLETVTTTNLPTQYVVEFSDYTGTDSFIGIRVTGDFYTYVEIDNIIWQPVPLCPDVTGLQKTATTMTTASIAWDGNTGTQWEVVIGADDVVNPDTLTPMATTDLTYMFETLTAGTTYKVWARTACEGALGNGEWAGPLTVDTQCEAANVPYIEDFETAATPGLPGCTSGIKVAEAPADWYTSNYPGYGFESNTLTYNGDLYADANTWFYTQGIALTEGVAYTISYRYGGASTDLFFYNNRLKVMYGTDASPEGMTLPIAEYLDFAIDAPVSEALTFIAPETGVFYFGFNVISPNNSYYMFIDDIVIDAAPLGIADIDKDLFTYYPNPVTDVLHVNAKAPITAIAVYTMLGQEVIVKSGNATQAVVDLSALAKGAYVVKITVGDVVRSVKVVKG